MNRPLGDALATQTITADGNLERAKILEIYVELRDGQVRLGLVGHLTACNLHFFSRIVANAIDSRALTILVDLRDLESIDHDGVSALLIAHLEAMSLTKEVLLIPASQEVQRMVDSIDGPFAYSGIDNKVDGSLVKVDAPRKGRRS